MEAVTDFTFLGSQITADGDCGHEIKRTLAPRKEIYDKSSVSCSVVSDFCDPMDCSLPGSSVHEILQARKLEWLGIPFSRVSSQPRDQTHQTTLHIKKQRQSLC